MDLLQHFNTFASYPGATVSHWTICAFAGFVLVYAESLRRCVFCCLLLSFFLMYEYVEFLRINDQGDVDIANGGFAFVAGVFLRVAIGAAHEWWMVYGERRYEEIFKRKVRDEDNKA